MTAINGNASNLSLVMLHLNLSLSQISKVESEVPLVALVVDKTPVPQEEAT